MPTEKAHPSDYTISDLFDQFKSSFIAGSVAHRLDSDSWDTLTREQYIENLQWFREQQNDAGYSYPVLTSEQLDAGFAHYQEWWAQHPRNPNA